MTNEWTNEPNGRRMNGRMNQTDDFIRGHPAARDRLHGRDAVPGGEPVRRPRQRVLHSPPPQQISGELFAEEHARDARGAVEKGRAHIVSSHNTRVRSFVFS